MQSKKCLWEKRKKKTLIVSCITSLSTVRKIDKSNKNTARINRTYSIVPMFLYYNMSAFIFFSSGQMNFFNFWSLVWIRRMNVEALIKSSGLRNDAVQCASFIFIIFKLKSICQKRWRQPSKDNKICHPT